ncbi:DUF4440 domain-containing protein [Pseudomonas chlororaphis]|jgi:hypothetical protein|uniref:DUF4440 domain-containing protein n=1 Tax=Pseudomonas morbosilactucae TaxID=2938197 RepID=A0ABT0JIV1_9PSED|nr:DUF4440 domain-containing protein [Pseudomonas morbosilactucae]MCK9815840.1 DUF4440 domain-containing protein [Pseudomonas morbosilactucae]ROL72456.1 DUF4440 domain-containing protein [Pseudomonas chlororaphis]
MNHNLIEQAQHSIHHVHQLIHRVFTDADGTGETSIAPLMSAFGEHFSMVTTSAATLDRQHLEQLFKGAVGGRPRLEIIISDLRPVWQEGETVAISYTEVQRTPEQENTRVSVAILRIHAGSVQWQYLHETPLSQKNRK